jgi:cytochrome b561
VRGDQRHGIFRAASGERRMGYTATAKWFHWITATLIIAALPTGAVIQHIKDPSKMAFYAIHESIGLLVLALALARLAWRLTHPVPPHEGVPAWMRRAADGVHHALYAAIILQPILGFFATNAFGFPMRGATAFLGFIDMPKFMEANTPLAEWLLTLHVWLGWTLGALLVLHVLAVVHHQAVRRDGTLLRMV